jgi:peptide/nickel transport system ATP-binding protein
VMRDGVFVEQGPAAGILSEPGSEYTQSLLDAVPSGKSRGTRLSTAATLAAAAPAVTGALQPSAAATGHVVLHANGLVKRYRGPDGKSRTVVNNVSFELRAGETLGVVGESGSGKTTTARIALALTQPDEGAVLLGGSPWTESAERARRARRRMITSIYQDPLSSFDPRWSVERIIADSLPPHARDRRVDELLDLVGLPRQIRDRRPLHLSGGQRQRVAIARAIAPGPSVIVCDEPVSALDVSIQAQVLDLLTDLQTHFGVSYLFISHDLGVIHHMSDHVLVMKDGRVVESGTAEDVFNRPIEPYTRQLLDALPPVRVA